MGTDIRYAILKNGEEALFKGLDPFEKSALLELPYGFAIGAYDKDGDSYSPVAYLVGTATDEAVTIEWMVVAPEYRFLGIGDRLLDYAFKMAANGGLYYLSAAIMPDIEKESMCDGAIDYFAERLFYHGKKTGADTYYQLVELVQKPFMKETREIDPGIVSLWDLPVRQRTAYFEYISSIENATYSFPPEGFYSGKNKGIFLLAIKNDTVSGAFFVAEVGDTLMPVYYYAKSDDTGAALIRYAIRAAVKTYGNQKVVQLTMRQPETGEMVERLLGEVPEGKLIFASVSEYLKRTSGQ